MTFKLGEGDGSHALMPENGFFMRSDFDPALGGVNPVLGFASGGAYAQVVSRLMAASRLVSGSARRRTIMSL
jgi:hypothetical protein